MVIVQHTLPESLEAFSEYSYDRDPSMWNAAAIIFCQNSFMTFWMFLRIYETDDPTFYAKKGPDLHCWQTATLSVQNLNIFFKFCSKYKSRDSFGICCTEESNTPTPNQHGKIDWVLTEIFEIKIIFEKQKEDSE